VAVTVSVPASTPSGTAAAMSPSGSGSPGASGSSGVVT